MIIINKNVCDVFYYCYRSVLFGQWGFGKTEEQGLTVLFHGAPGTGKSLAAEAVGYEVGKPLKVLVTIMKLVLHSTFVGC